MNETHKQNISKLNHLYQIFCSYGERSNNTKLSSSKFMKMMSNSNVTSLLNRHELELIFSKSLLKKSKTMVFNDFLNCLVLINKKILDKEREREKDKENFINSNDKSSMEGLINNYLLVLYKKLTHDDEYISDNENELVGKENDSPNKTFNKSFKSHLSVLNKRIIINFSLQITNDLLTILTDLIPVLYELYIEYFKYELYPCGFEGQNSDSTEDLDLYNISKESYFKVLKDLDIYPILYSKDIIYDIYDNVLLNDYDNENKTISEMGVLTEEVLFNKNHQFSNKSRSLVGKLFTFSKFQASILLLITKTTLIDLSFLSDTEKLCFLIERIEGSKGFKDIYEKSYVKGKKIKYYLLPEEMVINLNEKIKRNFKNEKEKSKSKGKLQNNSQYSNYNHHAISYKTNNELIRKEIISKYQANYIESIKNKYHNLLFNVFTYYSAIYDPLISNKMKFLQYERFIKQAGLVLSSQSKEKSNEKGKFLRKYEVEHVFNRVFHEESDNQQVVFKEKEWKVSKNDNEKIISISLNSISIDFYQFIYSIEIISVLLYGADDSWSSIDFMIENNINPINKIIIENDNNETSILNFYLSERVNNSKFVSKIIYNITYIHVYTTYNPIFIIYD